MPTRFESVIALIEELSPQRTDSAAAEYLRQYRDSHEVLLLRLKELTAYCKGAVADGLPHSPTLPSAISAAQEAIRNAEEMNR